MGAKQSKRSVDITGKEAEGAGEVAAAGAGGEGRVEPLADADALKPQLNGAAHIHEQTDKEKQLDSGTPENEKDATTEKESKEQEKENEKDKEVLPTTNGDNGEQKEENGDSSPAPEDGKKPKKEKVKKKWSLRSISFSRKDKPKPEKKQKEEEPKTNGEPEKVPEEAAETSPEVPTNEVAEEAKPEAENKDDKTPDTPVTEPLTNGSATPESPKTETPVAEEPVAAVPETNRPETVADPAPDQLPINGLSIDESKSDATEVTQSEECKPEKTTADTAELVPAPEIPVKKEVCVEQMPLIEPTPPPLPTNPPPSSVASFAATTMAPELTDASLSNNTESAIFSPPPVLDISAELPKNDIIAPKEDVIENKTISENLTEIPSALNEEPAVVILKSDSEIKKSEPFQFPIVEVNDSKVESLSNKTSEIIQNETLSQKDEMSEKNNVDILDTAQNDASSQKDAEEKKNDSTVNCMLPPIDKEIAILSEDVDTVSDAVDDLPPPLPVDNDVAQTEVTENAHISLVNNDKESLTNSNHTVEFIGEKSSIDNESLLNGNNENIVDEHNSKDSLDVVRNIIECNGNIEESDNALKEGAIPSEVTNIEIEKVATTPDDSLPPSLSEANDCLPATEAGEASESFPLPPSELCRSESEQSPAASPEPTDVAAPSPQELVSDKIADLIPEVPVIPELQTETETSTDVAVAN